MYQNVLSNVDILDNILDSSTHEIPYDPFLVVRIIEQNKKSVVPSKQYMIEGMIKYCYNNSGIESVNALNKLQQIYNKYYRR